MGLAFGGFGVMVLQKCYDGFVVIRVVLGLFGLFGLSGFLRLYGYRG